MDMNAAAELAELRRLALAFPGSTRLLDLAVIATLERLAMELDRLAGPSDDEGESTTPVALHGGSASVPPTPGPAASAAGRRTGPGGRGRPGPARRG
jgi:hypothetical protein